MLRRDNGGGGLLGELCSLASLVFTPVCTAAAIRKGKELKKVTTNASRPQEPVTASGLQGALKTSLDRLVAVLVSVV